MCKGGSFIKKVTTNTWLRTSRDSKGQPNNTEIATKIAVKMSMGRLSQLGPAVGHCPNLIHTLSFPTYIANSN